MANGLQWTKAGLSEATMLSVYRSSTVKVKPFGGEPIAAKPNACIASFCKSGEVTGTQVLGCLSSKYKDPEELTEARNFTPDPNLKIVKAMLLKD